MVWTTIVSLVSSAVSGVTGYFKHKQTIKELEKKAEIKAAENLSELDNYGIRQPGKKWVRRLVVLCVMYPYIGSFIPQLHDNVLMGFKMMENYPEWYILMLGAVIMSTIDYRTAFENITNAFRRNQK